MEELILSLLALALGLLVLSAPILAIVALVRSGRIRQLDQRLGAAERELARLRSPREGEGEAPAEEEVPPVATVPSEPPPAPAPRVAPLPEVHRSPAPPPRPKRTAPRKPPVEKPSRPRIEWERWVGVRGAAAVGGLVFALAGLLFFKHAFDQGWITPRTRVITGGIVGLVAIGVADLLRVRSFRFAPAAAAAGGVVVLYASTWASYRLYGFLSALAALPLMAIITAGCAWLSVRHRSQLVAVLGLVGGYATPLLLSIHADHPIGLFGYLLLLDLGILAVGLRMRWPSLAVLAVLGTFLVELVWSARALDSSFFPLALASLGAFALVFSAAGQRGSGDQRPRWFASQVGALLIPFAFATHFASRVDFGEELWPLAILAAVLAAGATWVGSKQEASWLPTGAAAGAVAVAAAWLGRHGPGTDRAWDVALSFAGLAAAFLAVDVWSRRGRAAATPLRVVRWPWSAPIAPAIAGVGLAWMLPVAAGIAAESAPWAWLVGALGLAGVLHLQGRHSGAGLLRFLGGAAAGVTLAAQIPDSFTPAGFPGVGISFLWMAGGGLGLMALAWRSQRREPLRESNWSWHAAAAFLAPLLFSAPAREPFREAAPLLVLGGTLGLAFGLALCSVAIRRGRWYAVAVVCLFVGHEEWLGRLLLDPERSTIAGDLFIVEIACVATLLVWLLSFRRRLSETRTAWRAAGVLLLLWFPILDHLLQIHFDRDQPAWTPLALALLTAAALLALKLTGPRVAGPEAERATHSAQRWFTGVLAFFVASFLARTVEHEVLIVNASLTGLGLAALWRWRETPLLKLLCLGFFGAAAAAVLGRLGQTAHYPNAEVVVFNWASYGTIVPAASALLASMLIGSREIASIGKWERRLYAWGRPWVATILALGGALGIFVWLNLQIFLYFETEPFLRIDFAQFPSRDLTMSIAWILYAVVILAMGMARRSSGMRWLSLAFLILSLGKVFLHDLGDLRGLYRVGSLLGLALSLLLVSVLYQRFVFPGERKRDAD